MFLASSTIEPSFDSASSTVIESTIRDPPFKFTPVAVKFSDYHNGLRAGCCNAVNILFICPCVNIFPQPAAASYPM